MVMKMNKSAFIKELASQLSYSEDECLIINDILENNFFLKKSNKDKIIAELINKLNINSIEANNIYEISTNIIKTEVKNKLRHPFQSQ